MELFQKSLQVCGLSQQEAAAFFDVRLDTVKGWCSGRKAVPDGVWSQLADLHRQIITDTLPSETPQGARQAARAIAHLATRDDTSQAP